MGQEHSSFTPFPTGSESPPLKLNDTFIPVCEAGLSLTKWSVPISFRRIFHSTSLDVFIQMSSCKNNEKIFFFNISNSFSKITVNDRYLKLVNQFTWWIVTIQLYKYTDAGKYETLTTLCCSGTKRLLTSWLRHEERETQCLLCWLYYLAQQTRCASRSPQDLCR